MKRAEMNEMGRINNTDGIVGFIARLYSKVPDYKRAKDHRFNNWQEIVEEIKGITIEVLAKSKDARLIGEGVATQFGGLTAMEMMDSSLVYYHIANMDKLLNVMDERRAMMILSLTSLTQREYEDVVMMFIANPDIDKDRNQWHNHWGLPDPEDEAGKTGFWRQTLVKVDEYTQKSEIKPFSMSMNLSQVNFNINEIPEKPGYVYGWRSTTKPGKVGLDDLQWSHDPEHWTKPDQRVKVLAGQPPPPPGSGPPTPRKGWATERKEIADAQRLREQQELRDQQRANEVDNKESAQGDGGCLAEGAPDPETGTGEESTTSSCWTPGPSWTRRIIDCYGDTRAEDELYVYVI